MSAKKVEGPHKTAFSFFSDLSQQITKGKLLVSFLKSLIKVAFCDFISNRNVTQAALMIKLIASDHGEHFLSVNK